MVHVHPPRRGRRTPAPRGSTSRHGAAVWAGGIRTMVRVDVSRRDAGVISRPVHGDRRPRLESGAVAAAGPRPRRRRGDRGAGVYRPWPAVCEKPGGAGRARPARSLVLQRRRQRLPRCAHPPRELPRAGQSRAPQRARTVPRHEHACSCGWRSRTATGGRRHRHDSVRHAGVRLVTGPEGVDLRRSSSVRPSFAGCACRRDSAPSSVRR